MGIIYSKFAAIFGSRRSASAQVLAIPELLETILLSLPADDLLRTTQVNKHFRQVTYDSKRLRETLFLQVKTYTAVQLTTALANGDPIAVRAYDDCPQMNPFYEIRHFEEEHCYMAIPKGQDCQVFYKTPSKAQSFYVKSRNRGSYPPKSLFTVHLPINTTPADWDLLMDSTFADSYLTAPALPCQIEVAQETRVRATKYSRGYTLLRRASVHAQPCTLGQMLNIARFLASGDVLHKKGEMVRSFVAKHDERISYPLLYEGPGMMFQKGKEAEDAVGLILSEPRYEAHVLYTWKLEDEDRWIEEDFWWM